MPEANDETLAKAFDVYYPLIEAMRDVRQYYSARVCSDPVGAAIEALNAAEKKMKIVRKLEVEEPDNG